MNNLRTYLLCFMICGLLPLASFGQSGDVVVLKATVAKNQKDKAHVDALNKLATIESARKPRQAYDYAQAAGKISKSIGYKWGYAVANEVMGDLQIQNQRFLRAARYHETAFQTMEALVKANKIPKQKLIDFISKSLLPAFRVLNAKKSPSRRERRAIRRYKKLNGQAALYHVEHANTVKEELKEKHEELKKKEEVIKEKNKAISDKNSELEGKTSALKKTNYQRYLLAQQKLILSLEKDSLSNHTDTLTRSLRIKEMKEKALMDSLILQDLEKKDLALKAAQHKAEQEKLTAENKQKKLIINFAVGGALIVLLSMVFIVRSYLAQKKANKLLALQKQALADRTEKIVKQKEDLAQKNEEITQQKDVLTEMNEEIQQRNEEIRMQMELIETQNETITQEQQISDALLLNILPEQVANELKDHGKAKIRHHEMVSVLFTDFKGFTKLAEVMPPEELVQELEKCFTMFDEIMDKHNLEKIKTIGDAYMAVGGLPEPNPTNFVDIVLAGLEIQRSMDEFKAEKEANGEPFWETRLGINTGKLIAGVIGKNKFAYDVWGDTVNTASRMESSGEIGRVNISGVTYELVKDFFECEYRGKIMAKNKGAIDMYFVNKIKAELSINGEGIEPNETFKAMLEEKSKEIANANPTMAA